MTETAEEQWLTASEARRALGCSQDTLLKLIERGELRPMRFGPRGWRRFHVDDVADLVERHREKVAS